MPKSLAAPTTPVSLEAVPGELIPSPSGLSSIRISGAKLRLALADLAAISAGVLGVSAGFDAGGDGLQVGGILVLAWAVWLVRMRMYRSRLISVRTDELRRIADAALLTGATAAIGVFLFDLTISRLWLLSAVIVSGAFLAVLREVVRRRYLKRRKAGLLVREILLIGSNSESEELGQMFVDDPALGYKAVGVIDPAEATTPNELTTMVLRAARASGVTGVVIAATALDAKSTNRLTRDLVEAGLHVELTSSLADIASQRLTVRPLGRFPVVYVEPRNRHGWRAIAKRSFDVVLAGLALVVLAPVIGVVAFLVKREDGGPIVFRQQRVGKNGEPFDMCKFRTMVVDAEAKLEALSVGNEGAGPLFKLKIDPRVTRVGAFLRKTSLDELPQLWNVLRNEMSLVGPRPALSSEMVGWDADLYARLRVKPGITGMWQVSGRSGTTFEEYTRLDLYYVDNWSLIVDMEILAKTLPAVLSNDGAY